MKRGKLDSGKLYHLIHWSKKAPQLEILFSITFFIKKYPNAVICIYLMFWF